MGETQDRAIWIDERTRNRLDLKVGEEADFEFQRVGLLGQFLWAWNASDPAYRVAARMALLSVILGAIGFVLGGLSLCVSLGARP